MQRVKINFDEGEKRHVRIEISATDGKEYPFRIRNAEFRLLQDDTIVAQGACEIEEHTLDAFIAPVEAGTYKLVYIYEIADETWVDIFKLKVSG